MIATSSNATTARFVTILALAAAFGLPIIHLLPPPLATPRHPSTLGDGRKEKVFRLACEKAQTILRPLNFAERRRLNVCCPTTVAFLPREHPNRSGRLAESWRQSLMSSYVTGEK